MATSRAPVTCRLMASEYVSPMKPEPIMPIPTVFTIGSPRCRGNGCRLYEADPSYGGTSYVSNEPPCLVRLETDRLTATQRGARRWGLRASNCTIETPPCDSRFHSLSQETYG